MRFGRLDQARRRLELLRRSSPTTLRFRYSSRRPSSSSASRRRRGSRAERAARLRKDSDQIIQLRYRILGDPNDLASRYQVAQWMSATATRTRV